MSSDQLDKIATGWNVGSGSLTLFTSISVDGEYMAGPEVIPHFDPGLVKFQGDGQVKTLGYQSLLWRMGILTYAQWSYLSSTYCAGGISGKVTISTTTGSSATYVRLNAILVLPTPNQVSSQNWYKNADLKMTRLAPAS